MKDQYNILSGIASDFKTNQNIINHIVHYLGVNIEDSKKGMKVNFEYLVKATLGDLKKLK